MKAHWLGTQGERCQFDYTWVSGAFPEGNCRLRVLYAGQPAPDILFTAQAVRLLLLGNRRYDAARLLAHLAADSPKFAYTP